MQNTRARDKSGFSLIEAVIASFVLALVATGGFLLVSQTYWAISSARDHYIAGAMALSTLERARNVNYSNLPLMSETNVIVNEQGLVDTSAGYYRRTVTVTEIEPEPHPLTRIEVQIDLRNRKTGNFDYRNESMSSLYTTYQ
jgi:Tfp pilus assembly protein PilV